MDIVFIFIGIFLFFATERAEIMLLRVPLGCIQSDDDALLLVVPKVKYATFKVRFRRLFVTGLLNLVKFVILMFVFKKMPNNLTSEGSL